MGTTLAAGTSKGEPKTTAPPKKTTAPAYNQTKAKTDPKTPAPPKKTTAPASNHTTTAIAEKATVTFSIEAEAGVESLKTALTSSFKAKYGAAFVDLVVSTTPPAGRRRLKGRRLAKTKFYVTAILAGKADDLSSGVTNFVSNDLAGTLTTICTQANPCTVAAPTIVAITTTAAAASTTAAAASTTAPSGTTADPVEETDIVKTANSFRCQLSVTIAMIFVSFF